MDIISQPLASLLNLSVIQGVYPAKLKLSKIISVYKSDDEHDPNNYRPTSLLSNLAFFLDLRKAFDTVDHNILLGKLQYYGFRGITSTWLSSYLSDRKQTTEIAGRISKQAYINCGVPQGPILGPLLFLIYINDIQYS